MLRAKVPRMDLWKKHRRRRNCTDGSVLFNASLKLQVSEAFHSTQSQTQANVQLIAHPSRGQSILLFNLGRVPPVQKHSYNITFLPYPQITIRIWRLPISSVFRVSKAPRDEWSRSRPTTPQAQPTWLKFKREESSTGRDNLPVACMYDLRATRTLPLPVVCTFRNAFTLLLMDFHLRQNKNHHITLYLQDWNYFSPLKMRNLQLVSNHYLNRVYFDYWKWHRLENWSMYVV